MLALVALALSALALFTALLAAGLALGAHRRVSSWGRRLRRRAALARIAAYGEAS